MWPAVPTTTDFMTFLVLDFSSLPPSRPRRSLAVLRARLAPPRSLFAGPHALEDLDEPQIDLPDFHVHAHDLHLDLVAEAIDLVRVLAARDVRPIDEPIVVVGHR